MSSTWRPLQSKHNLRHEHLLIHSIWTTLLYWTIQQVKER